MPKQKQDPISKEHREQLIQLKIYYRHYKVLEAMTGGLLKADTLSAICRDKSHGADETTRYQVKRLIDQQQEVLAIMRHRGLWTAKMKIRNKETNKEGLWENLAPADFHIRAGEAIEASNEFCETVTIVSHNGIRSAKLINSLLTSKHGVHIDLFLRDPSMVPQNTLGAPQPDLATASLYFLYNIGDILLLKDADAKSGSRLRVFTYDGRDNNPRAAIFGEDLVAICENTAADINEAMRGHPVHYDGRKVQGNQTIDVFLSGPGRFAEKHSLASSLYSGENPVLKNIRKRLMWTKDTSFSYHDFDFETQKLPEVVSKTLKLSQARISGKKGQSKA